jgi:hypothetical protein
MVFARQQLQVREFEFQGTVALLDRPHRLQALQPCKGEWISSLLRFPAAGFAHGGQQGDRPQSGMPVTGRHQWWEFLILLAGVFRCAFARQAKLVT